MTESELDSVYTQLCRTMTDLGEARAPLFLARLALLAISEIGDAAAAQRLIADASEGMGSPEPPPAQPDNPLFFINDAFTALRQGEVAIGRGQGVPRRGHGIQACGQTGELPAAQGTRSAPLTQAGGLCLACQKGLGQLVEGGGHRPRVRREPGEPRSVGRPCGSWGAGPTRVHIPRIAQNPPSGPSSGATTVGSGQ